jgi:hypothetical protein
MPLPKLTPEQRAKALKRSQEVRKQRAEIKADIKAGKKTLKSVLSSAKTNSVIGRMRVQALLRSLPGTGKTRALKAMEEAGVSETRRVAGLGTIQIKKLLEVFSK